MKNMLKFIKKHLRRYLNLKIILLSCLTLFFITKLRLIINKLFDIILNYILSAFNCELTTVQLKVVSYLADIFSLVLCGIIFAVVTYLYDNLRVDRLALQNKNTEDFYYYTICDENIEN